MKKVEGGSKSMRKCIVIISALLVMLTLPQNVKAEGVDREREYNEANEDEQLVTLDCSDLNQYIFLFGGLAPEGGSIDPLNYLEISTYATESEYSQAKAWIVSRMEEGETGIDVSAFQLTTDEFRNLYVEIMNENPMFFDVQGSRWLDDENGIMQYVVFVYAEGHNERMAALKAVTNQIMQGIDFETMSDVDIALYLHDYLVSHAGYAYKEYSNGTISTVPDVYNAYGALVNGYCVCQGYAEGYQYLLKQAGIPCAVISSQAMNHAWNQIMVDGQWYHVDACWDDPVWNRQGRVSHEYFLASDTQMQEELKHYGWTQGIVCETTDHDVDWWDDVSGRIAFHNGKKYYILNNSNSLELVERLGENVLPLQKIDCIRLYTDGGSAYYAISPYLSVVGDDFFWNDAQKVYKAKIDSLNETSVFFELEDENAIIIGNMVYEDMTLRYQTCSNESEFRNARDDYMTRVQEGLVRQEDGSYRYYENGVWNTEKFGFVEYYGSSFLVAGGKVANNTNGLAQDPEKQDDWYFLSGGQVQNVTSLVMYDEEWFYVVNGRLDTTTSAVVSYDGGLFYVGAGRIITEANGLAQDPNDTDAWYFLANGQVQTQYSGLAFYDGHFFYVEDGRFQKGYCGTVQYQGALFYVADGMMQYQIN